MLHLMLEVVTAMPYLRPHLKLWMVQEVLLVLQEVRVPSVPIASAV